jgi:hypothetical protein
VGSVAAVNQMGMAVDQARCDPAASAIGSLFRNECRWRVGGGAGINNAAIDGGDQAVIDQTEALARWRKRCKTASVPDAVDEGHDCHSPFLKRKLALRLFVYTYYSTPKLSRVSKASSGEACGRTVL